MEFRRVLWVNGVINFTTRIYSLVVSYRRGKATGRNPLKEECLWSSIKIWTKRQVGFVNVNNLEFLFAPGMSTV